MWRWVTKFDLLTLTQEQADRAGFDAAAAEGLRGPSAEVTLVGVVDGPSALDDPTPVAVVNHRCSTEAPGVATTIMSVGLRPGVDLSVLYVGTESQELYGIDAATGALISRKPLGALPGSPFGLLNAGEGTLLVPTDNRLVAFG